MPCISSRLPEECLSHDVYLTFAHLLLADYEFYRSSKVEMLIGSDTFSYAIVSGTNTIIRGNPSAMKTFFR